MRAAHEYAVSCPLAHHRFWSPHSDLESSMLPPPKSNIKGYEASLLIHSFSDKTAGPPECKVQHPRTLHRMHGMPPTNYHSLDHHSSLTMQFQGHSGATLWCDTFVAFSGQLRFLWYSSNLGHVVPHSHVEHTSRTDLGPLVAGFRVRMLKGETLGITGLETLARHLHSYRSLYVQVSL